MLCAKKTGEHASALRFATTCAKRLIATTKSNIYIMSTVLNKTIKWPGLSGKDYVYQIYPIDTSFNDVAGNYIFAKESSPGKWVSVYIGQTSSFKDRFVNHHKQNCINRHGATHIHAHTNTVEAARLSEERDLVNRWQPTCNG